MNQEPIFLHHKCHICTISVRSHLQTCLHPPLSLHHTPQSSSPLFGGRSPVYRPPQHRTTAPLTTPQPPPHQTHHSLHHSLHHTTITARPVIVHVHAPSPSQNQDWGRCTTLKPCCCATHTLCRSFKAVQEDAIGLAPLEEFLASHPQAAVLSPHEVTVTCSAFVHTGQVLTN